MHSGAGMCYVMEVSDCCPVDPDDFSDAEEARETLETEANEAYCWDWTIKSSGSAFSVWLVGLEVPDVTHCLCMTDSESDTRTALQQAQEKYSGNSYSAPIVWIVANHRTGTFKTDHLVGGECWCC